MSASLFLDANILILVYILGSSLFLSLYHVVRLFLTSDP